MQKIFPSVGSDQAHYPGRGKYNLNHSLDSFTSGIGGASNSVRKSSDCWPGYLVDDDTTTRRRNVRMCKSI